MAEGALGTTSSPVKGTGESTKRPSKWSYGHSPWDILRGAADDPTKAPDPSNIFGQLKLGADRTGAAIHQAGYNLVQPFTPEGQIQTAIWGPTDEPNSLLSTAKAFAATGAKSFGMDWFKNDVAVQEILGQDPAVDSAVASDVMSAPDVADIESQAGDIRVQVEQLDELAQGNLSETAQWQVNQMRMQLEDELDELQLQLEQAQYKLGFQDQVFDIEADALGLDLDLSSLDEAIQLEGGVGKQTLEAIHAIANDAALSAEQKAEAVDLVSARFNFSEAIVEGINEMVQNRNDMQRLQELTDVEFAHEMGAAEFFKPAFPEVIEVDDNERHFSIMEDVIMDSELGELAANLNDMEFSALQAAMTGVTTLGVADPQVQQLINNLAQVTQSDYNTWRGVLVDAANRVAQDEQAFEAAINAKSLVPGSKPMVYAIMNAGRNLDVGLDDNMLALLANAGEMHAIIRVKSDGKAGKLGEGTIRGIGGLTEEMYSQLMGEEWTPDRGMEWELQALLLYILRGFGGDPMEALDFYRATGEWGGVQSIGGGPGE